MDSVVVCRLSNMTSFQCGGSALIWFLWSGRKRLVFSVWIEISWVFVSGHRNLLNIRAGIKIDLISVINLVLASGSNLTCFMCGGQNRLRFCVQPENYLVLIYRSKLNWFLAWGSKLTCFWCAGRKWLVFSVSIKLDFVFVWVVEIDLYFIAGDRTWLDFSVGIGIDLVLVWGSKMAWF